MSRKAAAKSLSADALPGRLAAGVRHHQRGALDKAERAYRAVLKVNEQNPDALHLLGVLRGQQERYEEAERLIRRALKVRQDGAYWGNLGLALFRQLKFSDAELALRRSLAMNPRGAEAANHLGMALQEQHRHAEAEAAYRYALKIATNYPDAWNNLGVVLADVGRYSDAEAAYRRALALMPELTDASRNLGWLCAQQNRHAEAEKAYRHVLALQPNCHDALVGYIWASRQICAWENLGNAEQRLLASLGRGESSMEPFCLLTLNSTPADQLAATRAYTMRYSQCPSPQPLYRGAREPGKIRVGYLSPDFRLHPLALLLTDVLKYQDRTRFDVIAYSIGPDDGSEERRRIVQAVDQFVDLNALSDAQAAERIAADDIDILVDCNGYTRLCRPQILARRAAPVQVNYLGFPGTMGADFIDYIIVDPFLVPPGFERHYSEHLVTLPHCYQPNSRRPVVESAPSRAECGLPDDGFVFCCFNNSYKLTPRMFEVWMHLLRATPGSVLWLLESNSWVADNLRCEAASHSVSPERLVFAPKLPLVEHLARHRQADLFLDAFPCGAHTTASDALWVGLPVLCLAGETFASRVSGSIVRTIGLPELVTTSLADYTAMALHLARCPEALAGLRERLERNRKTSPLFDAHLYTRHLDAAFAEMWRKYRANEPTGYIAVHAVERDD